MAELHLYEIIDSAASARTRLNQFAVIRAMCENGLMPGGDHITDRALDRIIKICDGQMSRLVEQYDALSDRDDYLAHIKRLRQAAGGGEG